MYECKQNGEDFFSSLAVTCSRFGNHPANGLVTEQPQYIVVICIFSTSQNAETSLSPNGLRLIYTCLLSLALAITFHMARHNFGTLITLSQGVPLETVSRMMGHLGIKTTQLYAKLTNQKVNEDMKLLSGNLADKFKIYEDKQMPVEVRNVKSSKQLKK